MQQKKKSSTDRALEVLRSGGTLTGREELLLVVRLAFPSVLAQISFVLMQYIDASMVGHLGANESASIGLVTSTIWFFWGLSGACVAGFSVQAAHRIGANDFEAARSILRQAFTAVLIWSSLLALAGWLIHERLPFWLGGDPAIAADASAYFLILSGFLPVVLLNWLSGAFLRASADMKTPSFLGIAMCVLDVIFNALFIFPDQDLSLFGFAFTLPGLGMGVEGAAWGTVLAEAITGLALLWALAIRSPILRLWGTSGSFRPKLATLRRAVTIAAPLGAERMLMSGAQIVSTIIVTPLGVAAVAAHSLAITAESLCYMPGYGIGEAATTLVGQSVGARRPETARRLAMKCVACGMAVMGVMGAVLYAAAPLLMSMMTDVPELIALGAEVLRIEAWAEPMFAAAIVCHGAFVGAGDTLIPAIMNLASFWGVRLTLAWAMASVWGLAGVWTAMCIELIARGTIFLLRLRSNAWLKRSRKLQD